LFDSFSKTQRNWRTSSIEEKKERGRLRQSVAQYDDNEYSRHISPLHRRVLFPFS